MEYQHPVVLRRNPALFSGPRSKIIVLEFHLEGSLVGLLQVPAPYHSEFRKDSRNHTKYLKRES